MYDTEVAGPPSTLSLHNRDAGLTGREILCGTSDGKFGLMEMSADEPLLKWELANDINIFLLFTFISLIDHLE